MLQQAIQLLPQSGRTSICHVQSSWVKYVGCLQLKTGNPTQWTYQLTKYSKFSVPTY